MLVVLVCVLVCKPLYARLLHAAVVVRSLTRAGSSLQYKAGGQALRGGRSRCGGDGEAAVS